MKVITFSRHFLKGHPRAGEITYFVEKIFKGLVGKVVKINPYELGINPKVLETCDPKFHTFRKGYRWKVGDMFSARVWSGSPYRSKQIEFGQLEVKKIINVTLTPKTKTLKFDTELFGYPTGWYAGLDVVTEVAKNDGLTYDDFWGWFATTKNEYLSGQLICWNDKIKY